MDDIKTLSAEALKALQTEKKTALDALLAVETPTQAQYDEAFAIADDLRALAAEDTRRTEAADKFAALKGEFSEDGSVDADTDKGDEDKKDEGDADKGDPEADPDKGDSGDTGSDGGDTSASSSRVATLAKTAKRPEAPALVRAKPLTITAAADVPSFSNGQSLEGLIEVAKAAINRSRGFTPPTNTEQGDPDLRQFGTAVFSLDFADDMVVDDWHEGQEVFHHAADESRLDGGSLVAAGGWCAPSETVYDLSQDATTEGMLSLPEVGVRRGGMRYAQSPVFADFYANPGFKQTEAQAIAGTSKPCVEVPCPSFVDVRLDAVGICIKVPILTNAAYPEVVANFVAGTMVAHQHWINADVIGRIQTFAGAARVFAAPDSGSTTSDTLEALELVIMQRRQKYRLSMSQSMEVLVPFWVKGAIRADIGRRSGRGTGAVSDAEINAWFASVKANVQWLYDWQAIDETAEVYPATFDALVYPAGTFVKGTADVINLNTVYDAASLAVNTYTGLFAEQGLLVAKMKFGVDRITLPICNRGAMGALDQTCLVAA